MARVTNVKKFQSKFEQMPTSKVVTELIGLIRELDSVILNFMPEHKGLWEEDNLLIREALARAVKLEEGGD